MTRSLRKFIIVLVVSLTVLVTSNSYADAFVRRAAGEDWGWFGYTLKDRPLPPLFKNLNESYFGQALIMEFSDSGDVGYVVLPGVRKRLGVFKLQKSVDGTKSGARTDLVLPSKEAVMLFCGRLINAAHNHLDETARLPDNHTAFVSDKDGSVNEVIAVAYAVTQGTGLVAGKEWYWNQTTNNEKLTSANKYAFCSNPWGEQQNPQVDDENDSVGVKASGLANFKWLSPDSDKGDLYHFVCNDPKMAENEFVWFPPAFSSRTCGSQGKWATLTDPMYEMCDKQYDSLQEADANLGAAYCSGKLKPELR